MKQTFRSLLKNYIKDKKQVPLSELDFLREGYNHSERKGIKFSTMERTLRDIVKATNKQDKDGNYIHMDLFGYRIIKTTNDKGQITGYLVVEKFVAIDPASPSGDYEVKMTGRSEGDTVIVETIEYSKKEQAKLF